MNYVPNVVSLRTGRAGIGEASQAVRLVKHTLLCSAVVDRRSNASNRLRKEAMNHA